MDEKWWIRPAVTTILVASVGVLLVLLGYQLLVAANAQNTVDLGPACARSCPTAPPNVPSNILWATIVLGIGAATAFGGTPVIGAIAFLRARRRGPATLA